MVLNIVIFFSTILHENRLKSCCDLICLIGIVNTIVFRPVFAHKVLTTEESIPPEIPTTNACGLLDEESQ